MDCLGKQLFVVILMSLLALVVADNTSHLEKRQGRQPPALCRWMSPVIATMQPMQLGALAVKSALGLDSSESCHRDLQGRVPKNINAVSECVLRIVPEGLFHEPALSAAVSLHKGLSKGPSFQT